MTTSTDNMMSKFDQIKHIAKPVQHLVYGYINQYHSIPDAVVFIVLLYYNETFKYWRVCNGDDCGWRPGVTRFEMKTEPNGSLLKGTLIAEGYHWTPDDSKHFEKAVDGLSHTAWRPSIHAPEKGKVWIGYKFDIPVVVGYAYAQGLGVGSGGHRKWNGGIQLESSNDGINWIVIAFPKRNSDAVINKFVAKHLKLTQY